MSDYTLTPEEAISRLPAGDKVHTTIDRGVLLGADWEKGDVESLIREVGGAWETTGRAKASGHGLFLIDPKGRRLFIETTE